MTEQEVMEELESLGSEQTRKTYRRHGASDPMFGVSYAALGALKKKIGTDHDLALRLWATGNHDARILATMIVDPLKIGSGMIDAWARASDNYVLADAVSGVAAAAPFAVATMERWLASPKEYTARIGWSMLARAVENKELPDDYFERRLEEIEEKIHTAPNRAREAMNTALINIGARNEALRPRAVEAGERIGRVEIDHGDTGCKTPYAPDYIAKTWEHRERKKKK